MLSKKDKLYLLECTHSLQELALERVNIAINLKKITVEQQIELENLIRMNYELLKVAIIVREYPPLMMKIIDAEDIILNRYL